MGIAAISHLTREGHERDSNAFSGFLLVPDSWWKNKDLDSFRANPC
jgi:hypothetical protein